MTFYPDLGTATDRLSGEGVRAIGWLHPKHPYPQGEVPEDFLTRLKEHMVRWELSSRDLWWYLFRGGHDCEFCGQGYSHINVGIPWNGLLYVVPELVIHYIEDHGYSPPQEFISAVLAAPLPGTQEFREVVTPFRQRTIRRLLRHPGEQEEYDEWQRRHPSFPGVAACLESLRNWKGHLGQELMEWEIYANAHHCAGDIIEACRSAEKPQLWLLHALADARAEESRSLFKSLVGSSDRHVVWQSRRGLRLLGLLERGIDPWEPGFLGTWEIQGRPIMPTEQTWIASPFVFTVRWLSTGVGRGGQSYDLETATIPRSIDLGDGPWGCPGIYDLNGDHLVLCWRDAGQKRPRGFSARRGSGCFKLTLERRRKPSAPFTS